MDDEDDEQEHAADPLIARLAESIGARAAAATAFGAAVNRGHVTVIPVASTAWGFGGGGRAAATPAAKAIRPDGSGGGGGARVRPVGYILMRDDDAEFRPIGGPIIPLLALVGLGLVGGVVASRMLRK